MATGSLLRIIYHYARDFLTRLDRFRRRLKNRKTSGLYYIGDADVVQEEILPSLEYLSTSSWNQDSYDLMICIYLSVIVHKNEDVPEMIDVLELIGYRILIKMASILSYFQMIDG